MTVARDLAVQDDGKIVLAGYDGRVPDWNMSPQRVFAIARYTADGHLDATFGSGGKVRLFFGERPDNDGADAVAIDGAGRIIVAGSASIRGRGGAVVAAMAVIRLRANGSPDHGFGEGGMVLETSAKAPIVSMIWRSRRTAKSCSPARPLAGRCLHPLMKPTSRWSG